MYCGSANIPNCNSLEIFFADADNSEEHEGGEPPTRKVKSDEDGGFIKEPESSTKPAVEDDEDGQVNIYRVQCLFSITI